MTAKNDIGPTQSIGSAPSAASYGVNAPRGADFPGSESLRPGMQLNGVYEIDALLARGGMGEVYKGHSIQTGDLVAIKVIRADLAENEVAIALFRNEASKLHRLHNEAIIRYFVFSVDPVLQRTYLAMEFVEGEPLSQILRRAPLPPETVRRLACRVALGLHAAHKRDIIHRDVSSDNIVIQNNDVEEAKIIDFGIARSTQAGTTLIDIGFAGKLNYVSPEQLGLYGGDVGARSDIYSLGLVLIEALRGAPVDMGGTQVEVIDKRKSVPSLEGVDPRLAPVIEKMLQPDPAARQQSMQEVADDFARIAIESATRDRAAPPRGGSIRRPAPPAARRRQITLALGAGSALVAIALLAGAYFWLASPAQKRPETPQHAEVVLQPPPEQPPLTAPPAAPPVTEPEAPMSPATPPGVVTRESVLRYIETYEGAACFSILSAAATASSTRIEAIGAERSAFDELNAAFSRAMGFEADIKAILVPTAECAALDFYKAAKPAAALAPQVQIDTPFLRAGQTLTGSISGAKDRKVEALLISDDGTIQNVTNALPTARPRPFSLAVTRPRAGGQPQILMFVSSASPLASLKLGKPGKAAQILAAAETEAAGRQEQLGVAMNYFYVTE
ncbi:serine/threonine protein kinase [Methylocella silvestris BL2]|uniref:Serine/threonine protein kinase n=1 Tax=Methylocella silvestris (strain DSM 15510 / CIP 108128 / LMG 27833 / NCIMB 13906 / BL2) TaxID=395965 RepID=B8EIG0_METSB|nr:serine/threonine-protein kinase [Methylocella silvestris]ACK51279.1 serine/threonine protein kinase [Methylocella silvestris BL2]